MGALAGRIGDHDIEVHAADAGSQIVRGRVPGVDQFHAQSDRLARVGITAAVAIGQVDHCQGAGR